MAVRCVDGQEFALGEMAFLATFRVQRSAGDAAQLSGAVDPNAFVLGEVDGVQRDLARLVHYVDIRGDGWIAPKLDSSISDRDDRGWESLERKASRTRKLGADGVRKRWQIIHQAIREHGSRFYPPSLFVDPLS